MAFSSRSVNLYIIAISSSIPTIICSSCSFLTFNSKYLLSSSFKDSIKLSTLYSKIFFSSENSTKIFPSFYFLVSNISSKFSVSLLLIVINFSFSSFNSNIWSWRFWFTPKRLWFSSLRFASLLLSMSKAWARHFIFLTRLWITIVLS